MAEIKLNLSTCFNGYLPRAANKLKECRFRAVSYSPSTALIAEHPTEAFHSHILFRTTDDLQMVKPYLKVCYYVIVINNLMKP